MEILHIVVEVLKYVLPAALVLLAVKFITDTQSVKEKQLLSENMKGKMMEQFLPLKLSAYERATLFLERITPNNLIPRLQNGQGLSATQFQIELLEEIRSEYEHNLAQQIYINPESWAALVQAKEEILHLINQASKELTEDADGIALSRRIYERSATYAEMPTLKANFLLKTDILKMFES